MSVARSSAGRSSADRAPAPARPRVAVFCRWWDVAHDERSFVARSLAGALSRTAETAVFVPGPPGPARPDGAFDLQLLGTSAEGWPEEPATAAETGPPQLALALGGDELHVGAMVRRRWPGTPLAVIGGGGDLAERPDGHPATVVEVAVPEGAGLRGTGPAAGGPGAAAHGPCHVGMLIPVHPMAARQRHIGLGFTGYVLALSDRSRPDGAGTDTSGANAGRAGTTSWPSSTLARWLVARFPRQVVVVVEDALASVWRSRSLLGTFWIDTRVDLWRLMAHARVVVDLAPGPLVARETVEAQRYSIPVVVPAGGPAARLAAAGGGLWFSDVAELLGCVEALEDPALHRALGAQGHAATESWYGDTDAFVARVHQAVRSLVSTTA